MQHWMVSRLCNVKFKSQYIFFFVTLYLGADSTKECCVDLFSITCHRNIAKQGMGPKNEKNESFIPI